MVCLSPCRDNLPRLFPSLTNPLHCSFVIQALDTDGSALEKARNAISSKRHLRRDIGITSPRIIERQGVWIVVRKPWTPDIDEWTHYLHDATNNAVAKDTVVGPPSHLQWLANPKWSRHHDHISAMTALVSAGGRIFYIMDEGSRESIL